MAIIRIQGVPPWDGDYEFDLGWFTNRELRMIKEIADVRAGELEEEFRRGNNDLVVAVAVVAARRGGKTIPVDDLWDAPVGRIELVADEDADAGPPDSPTVSATGAGGDISENNGSSGPSSNVTSDPPAPSLSSTGAPGSETSSV